LTEILILEPERAWSKVPELLERRGGAVSIVRAPGRFGDPLPTEVDFGRFEALVTIPPLVELKPLSELAPGAWLDSFGDWVEGPVALLQAWLSARLNRRAPGRFVAVTSNLGLRAFPSAGAPGVGSAVLHTVVRVVALEYGRAQIYSNAIALGWHERNFPPSLGADGREVALTDTPAGSFASDDALAALVWWLAVDAPSQLTGHVVPLDGGYTITRGSAAAPSREMTAWLLERNWQD
jgi:NAD(P)-dependent dehydrogenase (short-subunit alcohol dehydrogenase family)